MLTSFCYHFLLKFLFLLLKPICILFHCLFPSVKVSLPVLKTCPSILLVLFNFLLCLCNVFEYHSFVCLLCLLLFQIMLSFIICCMLRRGWRERRLLLSELSRKLGRRPRGLLILCLTLSLLYRLGLRRSQLISCTKSRMILILMMIFEYMLLIKVSFWMPRVCVARRQIDRTFIGSFYWSDSCISVATDHDMLRQLWMVLRKRLSFGSMGNMRGVRV